MAGAAAVDFGVGPDTVGPDTVGPDTVGPDMSGSPVAGSPVAGSPTTVADDFAGGVDFGFHGLKPSSSSELGAGRVAVWGKGWSLDAFAPLPDPLAGAPVGRLPAACLG